MLKNILLGRKAVQKASSLVWRRLFRQTQLLQQTLKSHQPNNLEKHFLVWSGKYKSTAEVPDFVSCEEMERCRNKVRIRLANIMMALTVCGCIAMVISGKEAAKRGESVVKQNLDWHKQFNEQHSTTNKPTTTGN